MGTTWDIKTGSTTYTSGGPYAEKMLYTTHVWLFAGSYTFTINDAFGDGFCCEYGNGSYNLTLDDTVLRTGGSFGVSEATPIDVIANPTSSASHPSTKPSSAPSFSPSNIPSFTASPTSSFSPSKIPSFTASPTSSFAPTFTFAPTNTWDPTGTLTPTGTSSLPPTASPTSTSTSPPSTSPDKSTDIDYSLEPF